MEVSQTNATTEQIAQTLPLARRSLRRRRVRVGEEIADGPVVIGVDANKVKAMLCRELASRYVRRENRFFKREAPESSMTATDLKRVGLLEMQECFPELEITPKLWSDVCQFAIETVHSDRTQTIPVWNGRQECYPDQADGVVPAGGLVTLNTWKHPEYRALEQEADSSLLDQLLERVFPQRQDRIYFKDWLSWCLQNEGIKPGWAFLLFSTSKGTGKSSLAQTASKLFGQNNSITVNGIHKVTAKFNSTLMGRKLVVCEEVKLKAGTDAGNAIKAYITEPRIAVEGKGKEVTEVHSNTVFLMTTNHYPHWIEADDRRWYVADTNHAGNASGAEAEQFQEFMAYYFAEIEKPENVARVYHALMEHQQSNSFNPRSLNMRAIDTPVMKRLTAMQGEVLQQELEEKIAASGRKAIPQSKLRKLLSEVLSGNPNRIKHLMNELGWYSQKAKWGGVDYARVVWVHPEYVVANGRVTGPNGFDEAVDAMEDEVEII
ncbi:primase-helicase family protein [Arenibacterium sp. LLYu02]|uniref:primase-helicase family protein n=1 Tax=Arenibacterium sp. LLYu02 TaxID=3404132 RepID=UPI003B22721A